MAYQNNNGRKNNNRRFNNKNKNRRGGNRKFGFDEENITPQQRRQFTNKYESHLNKGKELQRNDRVEAENQFQHAEHYYRMSQLGLDKIKEEEKKKEAEASAEAEKSEDNNAQAEETNTEEDSATQSKPQKRKPNPRKPRIKKSDEAAASGGENIGDLPFLQEPAAE